MISADEVREYRTRIGIDLIRVASAEPFSEDVRIVRNRIDRGLIPAESPDEEEIFRRIEFYSKAESSLPQAKSIISLGMGYLIDDNAESFGNLQN
ncbi:MAG: hypothetical protein ACFFB3_08340 [Candidatus Hodarchaeota archaeon]